MKMDNKYGKKWKYNRIESAVFTHETRPAVSLNTKK